MEEFKKIKEFRKIEWQEIPDYGLYSEQVLRYLEENLISFFPEMYLSSSMINNYVKDGIIAKPIKKKYYREHIAYLIIITVLKQTIPIASIKEGIDLQTDIMAVEEAYNEFIEILERSLKDIIASFNQEGTLEYKGFKASKENYSLTLAINAFCFQAIVRQILQVRGLYDKENLWIK